MPPVTIQQVANTAGVSRSTANKVLLGESNLFRESTATKVLAAAESLGYTPNILARGLRQQRTYLLATMLSSVNAAFAYELSAGVQEVAAEHDCAPVSFSCSDRYSEARSLEICVGRRIDALLINSAPKTSSPENQSRILDLAASGMPAVEVFGQNLPGIPSIMVDFRSAGYEATKKLVARGCKEILFWSPFPFTEQSLSTPQTWFALDMYRGYQDAMCEAGLSPSIRVFDVGLLDVRAEDHMIPEAFIKHAREMLVDRPGLHAVVAPGETPANAVSHVLRREPGLAGANFSQAGFDLGRLLLDVPEKRVVIKIQAREVGAAAAWMAIEQIAGGKPEDRVIPPKIIT